MPSGRVLRPLSAANTTFGTEGRQARWMPYASLHRRRRPLRKYSEYSPTLLYSTKKALHSGELFDCLDQNILRIPVNP